MPFRVDITAACGDRCERCRKRRFCRSCTHSTVCLLCELRGTRLLRPDASVILHSRLRLLLCWQLHAVPPDAGPSDRLSTSA
ncbi:hypothetical protein PsYK624_070580 [Phanerochaete sordida]|uniref:Uncharacterized protein n=1 Tax=Phanerochaete sordida TaxID=48140 RepID=A0A9P3LEE7_9APHY|nr:hypothetical protein PsYK624_070580 [Phanerochaete sordida]